MNDPQIETLIYIIEHDDRSNYSSAKTVETEHTNFRLTLEGNEACFDEGILSDFV